MATEPNPKPPVKKVARPKPGPEEFVVFEVDGAIDPSGLFTRDHFQTLFNLGTLPVHASIDPLGSLGSALIYTGSYDC